MRIYLTPEELKELDKVLDITNAREVRRLIDYKKRLIDIHPSFMLYMSDSLMKKLNKPMTDFFSHKFIEPLNGYVNLILRINNINN